MPVSRPVLSMVATAAFDDVHVTGSPAIGRPAASRTAACNCRMSYASSVSSAPSIVTATGVTRGCTTTVAVPLLPSDDAVRVIVPVASARTIPVALTVATVALDDVHVIVRPGSPLFCASRGMAVKASESPTSMVSSPGETNTDATGITRAVTRICASAVRPSLAAMMRAVPAATAVTTPVALTVAMFGADDVQLRMRPVSTLLCASRTTAVSVAVSPATNVSMAGVTVTEATGTAVTVICATALRPSLAAVIEALPAATPVTTPVALTVAMFVADEVQVMVRPLRVLFCASRAVAVSVVVAPASTEAVVGFTTTLATAAGVVSGEVLSLLQAAMATVAMMRAQRETANRGDTEARMRKKTPWRSSQIIETMRPRAPAHTSSSMNANDRTHRVTTASHAIGIHDEPALTGAYSAGDTRDDCFQKAEFVDAHPTTFTERRLPS